MSIAEAKTEKEFPLPEDRVVSLLGYNLFRWQAALLNRLWQTVKEQPDIEWDELVKKAPGFPPVLTRRAYTVGIRDSS